MTLADSCEYKRLFMQECRLPLLHSPLYFRDEAHFFLYKPVAGPNIDSPCLEKPSVA